MHGSGGRKKLIMNGSPPAALPEQSAKFVSSPNGYYQIPSSNSCRDLTSTPPAEVQDSQPSLLIDPSDSKLPKHHRASHPTRHRQPITDSPRCHRSCSRRVAAEENHRVRLLRNHRSQRPWRRPSTSSYVILSSCERATDRRRA